MKQELKSKNIKRNVTSGQLYNKDNNHQYWEKDEYGKKLGVGICSDAFVYWLNSFVLNDSEQKAVVLKRNLQEYDTSLPTIFY